MKPVRSLLVLVLTCLVAAATHAHAEALRLENAHLAVWNLHDATSPRTRTRGYFNQGTAFAIGPDRMLTAFHVLHSAIERGGSLDHVRPVRTHAEKSLVFRLNRVLAIDLAHDLALVETRERTGSYLDFMEKDSLAPGEMANLLGYLGHSFEWMKPARGIVYADDFFFLVPTGTTELKGFSGGPVVNARGRVAGIVFYANANLLFALQTRPLRKFVAGKIGTRCGRQASLDSCFATGVENVREMAANGHLLAQFELGRQRSFVAMIDKAAEPSFELLEQAADRGLAWADFKLAFLYIRGIGVGKDLGKAFRYIERAAKKGFPPAMYWAGRFLRYGWGVPKNQALSADWLRQAADSGYAWAETDLKRDR